MSSYNERHEALYDKTYTSEHEFEHERWRILMSALDDLSTAITNLQTEQVAVVNGVNDLVAQVANLTAQLAAAGITDTAIEAAVAQINTSAAALQAAAGSDPGPQPDPTVAPTPDGPQVDPDAPAVEPTPAPDVVEPPVDAPPAL